MIIAGAAVAAFFRNHAWAKWAAGGVIVALVVAIVFWRVYEAGKDDVRQDNAVAVSGAKVKGAEAREAAAGERAADDAATAAAHEERANATKGMADGRPSDRDFQRWCVRLQQRGIDPSGVPGGERCGSASKAGNPR